MTASYPATNRQQQLLRFIAGYQQAHDGVSPSFREMRAGVQAPSLNNVVWLLNALEERGHIRRLHARPRAIAVLTPITIPRAPDGAPLFAVACPPLPTSLKGSVRD